MLETGIYLGRGVARMEETRGNIIRDNTISGHEMKSHCIAWRPGVSSACEIRGEHLCEDYTGSEAIAPRCAVTYVS